MTERTVEVNYLARVEGEGALRVRLENGRAQQVELRIFEPPRFFEALLRGRAATEAPDITARICGICPVAYQMSACHAVERALGVSVSPEVRALRRLLYCGEWIESHALHIYLLHAPDFLGYADAVGMAKDHPKTVETGLALKKAGNAILEELGGRAIHPVNVRVGGFYRVPDREALAPLEPVLAAAFEQACATTRFAAGLSFPAVEEDYEFVALRGPDDYPMNEGRLVSSSGLDIPQERFEEAFEEVQVPYSHALQARRRGAGPYLVGPLARYALNRDRLPPRTRRLADEVGLKEVVRNPYRSIVVRSVEVALACEEALRLIRGYRRPAEASVPVPAPSAPVTGAAITEAPRGILFHRYDIAPDGRILEARIVPPTSQNQSRIELDLRHLVDADPERPDPELAGACERAIRNHDPCISCATHFLKLEVERA
jgi:sulfhydrogenase subunit alpha